VIVLHYSSLIEVVFLSNLEVGGFNDLLHHLLLNAIVHFRGRGV
jgi:hypothetical protein